jgi:hypothetical protein
VSKDLKLSCSVERVYASPKYGSDRDATIRTAVSRHSLKDLPSQTVFVTTRNNGGDAY